MNAIPLLVMLSAFGIDFGWEPVAGGGIHYIVQIDPKLFDTMKEGTIVSSDLPEVPGGIRRYRIVVGTGPLPHQGEPLPQAPPPQTAPPTTAPTPAAAPTAAATLPAATTSPVTATAPASTEAPPQSSPTATHTFGPETSHGPTPADPSSTGAHAMTTPKPALDASTISESQAADEGGRPWMALTLTLLGLFASLGGNVFLGMVAWSQRTRFDELASRLKGEVD